MSVLKPRTIIPQQTSGQAMSDAGGLWLVEGSTDRGAVAAEVRERGLRALEIAGDLTFVEDLPELEFVVVRDPLDVAPLHSLSKLRLLTFPGTWDGTLDGAAWPALEWFSANEIPKNGGGVETLFAHPGLVSLGLGRPRITDLRVVTAPRLESLSVTQTRTLATVSGIEQHASRLRNLTLDTLSGLETLRGLETLEHLEILHLGALRQITTLEEVAGLPNLRFLDIFDLKNVETLAPLTGNATLEYIGFGKTADRDLDPLSTMPNLKLINTARSGWNRDVHELPYLHDVPPDDPRRIEWQNLAVQ